MTGDGDWVIQRLGTGPLDEDLTPAALQLRDGETLYLRPRDSRLPAVHFDDLIDGLATGVRGRPDRWGQPMTRVLFLAIASVALVACLSLVLDTGFPQRGTVAAAFSLMLIFAATLLSRALGDAWAALLCGVAALPFAALSGFLIPGSSDPGIAPELLAATAAATTAAVFAMAAIGEYRPVFLAIWLTGVAGRSAPCWEWSASRWPRPLVRWSPWPPS